MAAQKTDENNTFCTFSYEHKDGSRRFVVAHPETYWRNYIRKPPEQRHSYEVIPEGSPCWLYLDLEFKTNLNPESNGKRMTDTFINILCAYMLVHCGIHCNKTNVVNFDSTTNEKFSRHLIFSVNDVAFEDNLHVGRLVKFVCADIEHFLKSENLQHDILSYFNRALLEELFINTDKGKKLFVDTGVYTRNRNFRIYKSTKWGKRSYLTVCPDSKHTPLRNYNDKDLGIFLDSLISYFPNKQNLIIVKFDDAIGNLKSTYNEEMKGMNTMNHGQSPYPELDEFVTQMIYPGTIRAVSELNPGIFIYAITGNRYCENIGRWHKSNNIFWVVDLNKKVMYQKCHDSECSGFRSKPRHIPDEVNGYLKEKERNDLLLSCAELVEEYAQWDLSSYDDPC